MKPTSLDSEPIHDESEWLAQEAALAALRRLGAEVSDATYPAAYERIARFLAQSDVPPPPSNIAHLLASRVEALVQARKRDDVAFRRILRLLFGLGYGGCMALAVVWFPRDFALAADGLSNALLRSGALAWLPVVATCVGITGLLARRQARRTGTSRIPQYPSGW